MQFLKNVLCFGLMLTICSSIQADEKKQKKEKKAPSATQRLLNGIELTDAQKEQVAAIDKEFAEELRKLNETRGAILTAEQKTAERDAQKAAKAAGKTPAETKAAVDAALKLTDEQKTKMQEFQKTQQAFNAKVIENLRKILTPEQQEKLPKQRANGGKGKKKTE